jgi:hypothetical protein
MPRVPSVQGPTVDLQGLPDAYQRAPQALGAAGMEQARELGQVVQAGTQVSPTPTSASATSSTWSASTTRSTS